MSQSPEVPRRTPAEAGAALVLAASAALAAGVFLFVPLQVYLGNIEEYSTPAGATVLIMSGWCAIAFSAIAIPGMLLRGRARRWYCLAVLLLALGGYLQSNFLVWNYGLLDGRELRWTENRVHGFIDLSAWVCLVVAGIVMRHRVLRLGIVVSWALIAIQLLGAGYAFLRRDKPPSHHFYTIVGDEVVTFSPTKNIVVVLLDEFQSNVFSQILEEDPGLKDKLKGFVYYPNAVSGYAKTMGSVPNILTGRFYDNSRPLSEFLEEAYHDSVMPALRAAGYKVELYPVTEKLVQFDPRMVSNIVRRSAGSFVGKEPASLMDAALFRCVPHDVKKAVVGDGVWLASRLMESVRHRSEERSEDGSPTTPATRVAFRMDSRFRDLEFVKALRSAAVDAGTAPRFKFIHLQGPHEPFIYDENMMPRRLRDGPEGYLRQARGSLRILIETLSTLERIGVKDNTDLIVISDHGAGEYGIPPPGGSQGNVPAVVRSSGLPLVLIRRAGGDSDFSISRRPVSLAQIGGTVATLAGIAYDNPQGSILGTDAPQRERRYYHYYFDGWDRRYLPSLSEYLIDGDSWDPASWHSTGRVLKPGDAGGKPASMTRISVNERGFVAAMGAGKPSVSFLKSGWADPEPNEVWTSGKNSILRIPVPDNFGPGRLRMKLRPFLPAGREFQTVEATVDGAVAARWIVGQARSFGMFVPREASKDGVIDVALRIPDAVSPADTMPGSTDQRILGVAVNELSLDPVPDFPESGMLDFKDGGNAAPYELWGWSVPEPNGTWTVGRTVGLLIPGGPRGSRVRLRVVASPYLHGGRFKSQNVVIRREGAEPIAWEVSGSGAYLADFDSDGGDWIVLELSIPNASSPIDLPTNPSPDPRRLGIMIESVQVVVRATGS